MSVDTCEHGHLARKCELCELKAEVAKLRSVCREAADEVAGLRGTFVPKSKYPRTHEKVTALVVMLDEAGKEATDGQ